MRVFVTGASGFIGSAAVAELLQSGHTVVGLARSDAAADRLFAAGAEVHRGDLDDLDSLRAGAEASDGVVHLGYNHDFSQMEEAAKTDLAAVNAIGAVLEGTGRPFFIASGVVGLADGRVATERDMPDPSSHPRVANALAALSFADRGVRVGVLRFAPTVHGPGDHGFVAVLVKIAQDKGMSAYIDTGANRWPAVHRLDAGNLVRRAVESAPSGSVLHAVAEEGVPTRVIAEAIGRGLNLPVVSIPREQAPDHFGFLGHFFGMDIAASSAATRQLLGWNPTHPYLVDDIDAGRYFSAVAVAS